MIRSINCDGAVYQRGNSWEELPQEIKDYYRENATDENPLPLNAETIERISEELVKMIFEELKKERAKDGKER